MQKSLHRPRLNFMAAFDSAHHPLLLETLSFLDFQDASLPWFPPVSLGAFSSYLAGSSSSPWPPSACAPQSSVLGPLLLTLASPSHPGFQSHLNSDNSQCMILQARPDVSIRMSKGRLRLDPTKPDLLIFISVKVTTILPAAQAKNLGFTLDVSLPLIPHAQSLDKSYQIYLQNVSQIGHFSPAPLTPP